MTRVLSIIAAAKTSRGNMKYYDFGLAPNPRRVNVFINEKGLEIDSSMFKPQGGFAVGAVIVFGILAALYIVFW